MANRTHIVAVGETFETISSRYFGEPGQAIRIRNANPGSIGHPIPGTRITIPESASNAAVSEAAAGLVVRIDGVEFQHVEELTITRSIEAVDTVEIVSPLAATEAFEDLIKPFTFRDLEITDKGARVFTGILVSILPAVTADEGSRVRMSGYSTPGVLGDCMAPASSYPISFRKMGLVDIARRLADPFSVNVVQLGDVGGPFRRVKLKRDQKMLGLIVDLAKQRQVLVRSNTDGDLVLSAPPAINPPVATLSQSEAPLMKVVPFFSPQKYYSHVTGVRMTKRGNPGSQYTVTNADAAERGIVRPLTVTMRDVTRSELPKATEALAGRMLANAVGYGVAVPTWYDADGAIWTPGDTIQLEAPDAFIRQPYDFQIRSVTMKRGADGDTSAITLMLPGAFGGTLPTVLPWS